jgi:hypothetical protein
MGQPCEFQVDALGVLQTSRNRSAFSSQTPKTRIGYLQTHRRPGLRCHFPRGISSAIDCCIIDKRMPQSILDASTPSPLPPRWFKGWDSRWNSCRAIILSRWNAHPVYPRRRPRPAPPGLSRAGCRTARAPRQARPAPVAPAPAEPNSSRVQRCFIG